MTFNGKVLLVDDEAHIRKFVSLILKQLGTPSIIEAGNGSEAVSLYAKEKPDLVLLDINMPVMDGLAALRSILAVDPEALVIMLTSLSNRQMIEQAAEIGAVNYIRKDTPKDELLRSLRETIAGCFEDSEGSPQP